MSCLEVAGDVDFQPIAGKISQFGYNQFIKKIQNIYKSLAKKNKMLYNDRA